MKVSEVYDYIDLFAPFCSQEDWDNSGLLIGSGEKETDRILVCLDITEEAVRYAAEKHCGLIVSHHPVIFRALKQIACPSVLSQLIQNDISVISAHTNLDKAPGGVNDTLCEVLGMTYEKLEPECGGGFLNAGFIPECKTAAALREILHEKLHGTVRSTACPFAFPESEIGKIAVCAGAGGEFFADAKAAGCNTLITGDADHHDFLDAAQMGVHIFAVGHYETEIPMIYKLAMMLENRFLEEEVALREKEQAQAKDAAAYFALRKSHLPEDGLPQRAIEVFTSTNPISIYN